jgi:hypothetical protein
MALPRKIVDGVTDRDVCKRIGWPYVSFLALFVPVNILSFYLLPEGVLRGKHPIISALEFSSNLWISTALAFVLLLCAAFVESYGIIHLTG